MKILKGTTNLIMILLGIVTIVLALINVEKADTILTIIAAITLTLSSFLSVIKNTKPIKKAVIKTLYANKLFSLSLCMEYENKVQIEKKDLFFEDRDFADVKYKLIKQPNALNHYKMVIEPKNTVISLSLEYNMINDYIQVSFNNISANRKSIKEYLKYCANISNVFSTKIGNQPKKVFVRISFPENKNPYLNYYISDNIDKKNYSFEAKISVNENTFINNSVIEIKTNNFIQMDEEIDNNLIKLI